jgi:hypothetical protein
MKKKRENNLTDEALILNNYYSKSEMSQKELEELNRKMNLIEETVYTLQHPPSQSSGYIKQPSKLLYQYSTNHY